MEPKILKRRIKLKPLSALRRSEKNPYLYGLIMKRKLTTREACYIYRHIFLFNIDLSLEEGDKIDNECYYRDITEAMNLYIKGIIGWTELCDRAYCYDDDDMGPSVASCIRLAEYLQEKKII